MGKKRKFKKNWKKHNKKRMEYDDEMILYSDDILGDEKLFPEEVFEKDFGVLNTHHNGWYERLICKRLAKRVANRRLGLAR